MRSPMEIFEDYTKEFKGRRPDSVLLAICQQLYVEIQDLKASRAPTAFRTQPKPSDLKGAGSGSLEGVYKGAGK